MPVAEVCRTPPALMTRDNRHERPDDRQPLMPGDGSDPRVVDRDRRSRRLQLQPNGSVDGCDRAIDPGSVSICSNSASTSRWIRAVSERSSARAPKPFIHGGSAGPSGARCCSSLSRRVSITNCRRLMPLIAARAFAKRNNSSGISIVVFIPRSRAVNTALQKPVFTAGACWDVNKGLRSLGRAIRRLPAHRPVGGLIRPRRGRLSASGSGRDRPTSTPPSCRASPRRHGPLSLPGRGGSCRRGGCRS